MLLGVFRREVLGGGAGAVAGPPDGRAAWGAAPGGAHMRGAKALGPAHAVCIAPQGAVDTLSVAAYLRDLEMPRGAAVSAHAAYDPLALEPANELRRRCWQHRSPAVP